MGKINFTRKSIDEVLNLGSKMERIQTLENQIDEVRRTSENLALNTDIKNIDCHICFKNEDPKRGDIPSISSINSYKSFSELMESFGEHSKESDKIQEDDSGFQLDDSFNALHVLAMLQTLSTCLRIERNNLIKELMDKGLLKEDRS